ncbi:MAG: hypothetical protein KBS94_04780 [Prevotella sp.]|nr:hypothetical protein [Candidatus Equicola faecalis]
MILPNDFTSYTRALFGEELYRDFLSALDTDPPVSIRINPYKPVEMHDDVQEHCECVPWCNYGFYLASRPNFTFDPLFHAGCYYVQEASSMFLAHVMQQYVSGDVQMLDLCAAPGGKSTCARSMLSADSVLICNEPIRKRASVLAENVEKFDAPNMYVTNLYPQEITALFKGKQSIVNGQRSKADCQLLKPYFDVILADVPCSGEGMFRKDETAVREWSPSAPERCATLQRQIVSDIWPCLRPGGLLIYSTCTFNTHENEENVRWICSALGARLLPIDVHEDWHICGSLLDGFHEPVYRFIPGRTRGEGLFMAVLRKDAGAETITSFKDISLPIMEWKNKSLPKDLEHDSLPSCEVDYYQALHYLRREAIALPKETPRGEVVITYQGQRLGLAKNVGNRANNLYPKEWAIRTTYLPSTPFSLF